ncbi:MAG: hypothetical protein J6N22_03705 [Schwartzia sp.]|nr:hypothetical protein [Schwartzia sp. (in: firmicutes)]
MALGIGTAGSLRRIWWLYLVAILTRRAAPAEIQRFIFDNLKLSDGAAAPLD